MKRCMSDRLQGRRCRLALALPVTVLVALLVAGTAAARPKTPPPPSPLGAAPVSSAFKAWRAGHLIIPQRTVDGRGLGLRPGPQRAFSGPVATPSRPLAGYASSFDLRPQGRLSPVKNQNPYGTCWSFATYGSLESFLLPAELLDFSEDNMVLTSGFDTGSTPLAKYNYGGNLWMSTAYLTRWGGPVYEADDPYGDSTTPGGLTPRKHVQDVLWFNTRSSSTDNDRIKYAVSTHGAAYVSMSFQGSSGGSAYYNATTHAYYYNGSAATNHAVCVVGWDDDYPASNFATTPAGNGAFIVRNSWGTGWGESGYFYVSYYDAKFGTGDYTGVVQASPAAIYESIYQYDPLGDCSTIGGGPTLWGANRFVASSTTIVRAVGTYAVVPNTAYEVWTGSSLATLTKATGGTFADMGFHTIALPAGYPVTSGAAFVVAVKLTTPGYNWPLAFEAAYSGYSSTATAAAGQSYYSFNGTSWTDLTTFDATANACIKAYASNDTAAPVTGDNAGAGWHAAPFTLTLDPVDAGSGMVGGQAKTEWSADGGATWTTGKTIDFGGWRRGGGSGTYPLLVHSTDALGNLETPARAVAVKIDTSRPTSADDAPIAAQAGPVTVHLTGRDTYSGVATIVYSLDGGGWTSVAYPGGAGVPVVVAGAGTHTLRYYAVDGAGNSQTGYRVCVVPVL